MGLKSNIPVPCLVDQVDTFLRDNAVFPNDLYAFMIGANDIYYSSSIDGLVPALSSSVERLFEQGITLASSNVQ